MLPHRLRSARHQRGIEKLAVLHAQSFDFKLENDGGFVRGGIPTVAQILIVAAHSL
jgi:hypothetical protein